MRYYWWCLTCGKQGMIKRGHKHLNQSLREHAENAHQGEKVEYLTINEYGTERAITYENVEVDVAQSGGASSC